MISSVVAAIDNLDSNFTTPPTSAKPWTFWWFEGGYASETGMARDIAEMRAKGIGGVLHMQTLNSSGMPLPSQPPMLGDKWAAWFGEAARLAGNSGISMGASIVDGWGQGGPWVTAEKGAKMLVYSEHQVDVSTPGRISKTLQQPNTNLGVYHDVAVIAFPDKSTRPLAPSSVTANSANQGYCGEQNWPVSNVTDGDPDTFWRAGNTPSIASPAAITSTYPSQITAVGALIAGATDGGPRDCELQKSTDSRIYTTVTTFSMQKGESKRIKFTGTTAKYFRLIITSAYVSDVQLAEFSILRSGDEPTLRYGVKWWSLKSGNRGYWRWPDQPYDALEEDYPADGACDVRRDQIIDVTQYMQANGQISWKAPKAGRWTIMRFGWTPVGQPARMSSNGGYEVDVLNVKGADLMADSAQNRMLEVTEAVAPGALTVFHTDSWEIGADVGGQQPTWTDDFAKQFRDKRGYDLVSYLPVMAQRLVDNRDISSRFLRDYRNTIADLLADYYARQQERAHQRGCLVNPESGYGTYPFPQMDGLKVFGRADLPMAESWHNTDVMSCSDLFCDAMRTAASGARIYGRQIVQAETLTFAPLDGPVTPPEQYRGTLNHTFAEGINQVVIHKYVHQPFEYKPGLEDYGIYNRHYTWWPMADGFFSYIARCQYLLQQGLFAADAAYFVGEGASRFVPGKAFLRPSLPSGYDYDGINAEVLLTRASVKNGKLTLTDGLNYRYLVLCEPQCTTMSPEVLAKIAQLVKTGVTLIGSVPRETPGLTNRASNEARFKTLVTDLWGKSPKIAGTRTVGKGRVIWGRSMEDVFRTDHLSPDVGSGVSGEERTSLQGASWIWHAADGYSPPPGQRKFRTYIEIPKGRTAAKAMLSMTADNSFKLSINEAFVCSGNDWNEITDASITRDLHSGSNEILVTATNGGVEGNPAGVIGSILVILDNGDRITCKTDAKWLSSAADGKWTASRIVGPIGSSPWGHMDLASSGSVTLEWLHRRTSDSDIYFLANPANREISQTITLRVTGRVPELFDPMTGKIRPLPEFKVNNGSTVIPMVFSPHQAYFIVFRSSTATPQGVTNFPALNQLSRISGPWKVKFDPAWVSPALGASGDAAMGKVVFDDLIDWTQRPEYGIKHYSGIATYSTSFNIAESVAALPIYLDLGTVKEVARVRVNGKDMGVVWSAPWKVDISAAIQSGLNALEIDAANLWSNRIIADAALPEAGRLTKGTFQLSAQNPLSPSGLLGPVTLIVDQSAGSPSKPATP